MDVKAMDELNSIKKDLQHIIDDLYNVAHGINKDFEGIGNEKCANSIIKAANQYETVKKKLNNMDLSAVTAEFLAKKQVEAAKALAKTPVKAPSPTKTGTEANQTTQITTGTKKDINKQPVETKDKKSLSETSPLDIMGNFANAIVRLFK